MGGGAFPVNANNSHYNPRDDALRISHGATWAANRSVLNTTYCANPSPTFQGFTFGARLNRFR